MFMPEQSASACATCFGESDAPMAEGMNAGIFTLLIVVGGTLAGIATFFIYSILSGSRRSSLELHGDSPSTYYFMNKNYIGLIVGAIAGVAVAVLLVNSGKDEETGAFTAFDPTVEYTMSELFKSPPPITEHGKNVDRVLVFVHVLMGVLFVGWSIYFINCIFRFRESTHTKA